MNERVIEKAILEKKNGSNEKHKSWPSDSADSLHSDQFHICRSSTLVKSHIWSLFNGDIFAENLFFISMVAYFIFLLNPALRRDPEPCLQCVCSTRKIATVAVPTLTT